jgi:hypothetical protein
MYPNAVLFPFMYITNESPDLTDSPDLAGAFCVWLTQNQDLLRGLNGRFLSSKWDVDELLGKLGEIVDQDLLRARFAL